MRFVWTMMALAALLMPAGAQAGQSARLMADSCTVCHGHGGHGPGSIPSLAGKHSDEMMKALMGFRDGSRAATVMDRLVRGYTPEQLQAIVDDLAARKGGAR